MSAQPITALAAWLNDGSGTPILISARGIPCHCSFYCESCRIHWTHPHCFCGITECKVCGTKLTFPADWENYPRRKWLD